MIRSIDIPNFGSFRDFVWNDNLRDSHGNVVRFRRMNIIYGRNYSGKTTLSRIVRFLETGHIPKRYEMPDFTVVTDVGNVTSADVKNRPLAVRVYNRDFTAEHLSFLTDESGEITPFAVLGRDNTETEQEIQILETRLGSHDPPTGLMKSLSEAGDAYAKAKEDVKAARDGLEAKLSEKANRKPGGIKHDPLFRDPNYNITKIRADIDALRSSSRNPLSEDWIENLRNVLSEKRLQDVRWDVSFSPKFAELRSAVAALLSRELRPSAPIEELLADPELQRWVKTGIPLHQGRRNSCAFCTGQLTTATWTRLADHFDKASTAMEVEIDTLLRAVDAELIRVSSVMMVERESLYESLRPRGKEARDALIRSVNAYSENVRALADSLRERKADLFSPRDLDGQLEDHSKTVTGAMDLCMSIIREHNGKSDTLAADQAAASEELRLNEVLEFIKDIDLESEEKRIAELALASETAKGKYDVLSSEVTGLQRMITELRLRLKDESQGAEKVNQYLTHYFGHESLRLKSVDSPEGAGSRFKIFRGEAPAYNLSEGECSLVAFCYFVARLEATDAVGRELIIFIDDPISSLDDNHIFFIYSLIESVIARRRRDPHGAEILGQDGKPVFRYRQLFIATHNLDFLKYCKRLDRPRKDCGHFLILSKMNGSRIEEMPNYLKNYVTEFNYLFDEICVCVDPDNKEERKHSFYSFGNNLRKFLEAYMFFKYPSATGKRDDHQRRVERFFQGEEATEPLIQRVVNELSHLSERFDRSVQPIDIAEINKIAAFVLKTIRRKDPEQYDCLLESVSREDPLPKDN